MLIHLLSEWDKLHFSFVNSHLRKTTKMPYRRLPNTDSARLKALKLALDKGENLSPREKPYSQSSLNTMKRVLPQFEHLLQYQKEAYKAQTEKSPEYNYLYKKAKNYVSHFIQVLNLAIIRGDLKREARPFFNLEMDVKKLPQIKTEQGLLKWGEIVIKGEPERIGNGGNPLTNPTVGIVRVHFEKFVESYRFQKNLQENYARASKQVAEFRPEVDQVILQLWNEIEASFEPNSEVARRNICRDYGLVYFFRRNEIIPKGEKVSSSYRKNRVVNKDLRESLETEVLGNIVNNTDLNVDEPIVMEASTEPDFYADTGNVSEEEGTNENIPKEEISKDDKTDDEDTEGTNFQYSLF